MSDKCGATLRIRIPEIRDSVRIRCQKAGRLRHLFHAAKLETADHRWIDIVWPRDTVQAEWPEFVDDE